MPRKQGTLEVNGEVAYCGQSVQLLARATLQENILFGLPLDLEMYERAMTCTHCQEWVADVLPRGILLFSLSTHCNAVGTCANSIAVRCTRMCVHWWFCL